MDEIEREKYVKEAAVDDDELLSAFDDDFNLMGLIQDSRTAAEELESAAPMDYMDTSFIDDAEDPPPTVVEKSKPTPIVISPTRNNGPVEPKFSPTTMNSDEEEETTKSVFSMASNTTSQMNSMPSQSWRLNNQQRQSGMPELFFKGRIEARAELDEIMTDPVNKLKMNREKYNLDRNRNNSKNRVQKPGGARLGSIPPALRVLRESQARCGPYVRPMQHQNKARHYPLLQNFDLRDKLPYRPSHTNMLMPYMNAGMPGPSHQMGHTMVPFQNQITQFMQMMPLFQSAQVAEGVNQSFGAKYNMDTQRKIAEIQGRPFRYTCDTLAPITLDGAGIDVEFTPKGGNLTMNMRFS